MIESPVYEQILKDGMEKGMEKGKEEALRGSVLAALETRFGMVPGDIGEGVASVRDINQLEILHRKAVVVEDFDEFREFLKKVKTS